MIGLLCSRQRETRIVISSRGIFGGMGMEVVLSRAKGDIACRLVDDPNVQLAAKERLL